MASLGKQLTKTLPILTGILLSSAPAFAQDSSRAFLGANVGVHVPAGEAVSEDTSFPFRGESARVKNDYQVATSLGFDANIGYLFHEWLGAGLAFDRFRTSHRADYLLTRPHPTEFGAAVTRTGTTDEDLDHSQRGFHLQLVMVPPMDNGVDVKIFVGPSKLYVKQQLIEDFEITETLAGGYDFTVDGVEIGDAEDSCACAWGFHIGADVTKYVTPTVGFGAMLRYSRATVDLKNATQSAVEGRIVTHEYTAGGFIIGGGIRIRVPMP